MHQYPNYDNYDTDPVIPIDGWPDAVKDCTETLRAAIAAGHKRFAFVLYPGVLQTDAVQIAAAAGARVVFADEARFSQEKLDNMFREHLTDDRVFGVMTTARLQRCFDPGALAGLRETVAADEDTPVCVVGVGAALVCPDADETWYFDITRWEIQMRFRRGASTWMFGGPDKPQLTKYKEGFFVEWRLADRHKTELLRSAHVWVDASVAGRPRCVSAEAFLDALRQTARRPFHMQAYFDQSVWGGQWMKTVFQLDASAPNYGWAFDGVPEENALKFLFGSSEIVFPAMDLVKAFPEALLGYRVYSRFGAEFPIRFDLLDTFGGGNLSLQVHPSTQYIQENFGMHYTQDESYYILDANADSCVYLGVRPNTQLAELRAALEAANAGEGFDAEKFVNRFPVKKHDHVLIPAGTLHCSGQNTLVLEISATPYIFTFKLWDWDRIGLDGRPRPVHIGHGMNNIRFERDTEWVKRELLNRAEVLSENSAGMVERTGLHRYEFIETHRYTVSSEWKVLCDDSVTVINLVEGERGIIKSADGRFPPQEIHYAETFVIPADAGDYVLCAPDGRDVRFLCATVRG